MQVSVEATEGLERKLTVQVPAERVEAEVEQRLKSMVRSVRIDGFRPGKAPLRVIRQRYGVPVRQEVVGELVHHTLQEALAQEKLMPAGAPAVETNEAYADGLEYTATFEVYPEVALKPLSELAIERVSAEVGEADVDAMIERLRKQRAGWSPVERPARNGDRVMIDFKGFIDGEAFQGGEGSNYPLELGSNNFIPGFEEQLVGAGAGEERSVEVSFPEDYRVDELAGKATRFEVKVISVSEVELPEVNDEFAKEFGVEEGGVEGLRAEVRGNMERELRQAVKGKVKQQVMDKLLEHNPVEVPKAMIGHEVEVLRRDFARQSPGMQSQNMNLPAALFEEQARRRIALGLLIHQVMEEHQIKLDQERVQAAIQEMASAYEKPEEVVNFYKDNAQYRSQLEANVLEEQVVDFVLAQAQVSDKPASFDEVMNRQAQA